MGVDNERDVRNRRLNPRLSLILKNNSDIYKKIFHHFKEQLLHQFLPFGEVETVQ